MTFYPFLLKSCKYWVTEYCCACLLHKNKINVNILCEIILKFYIITFSFPKGNVTLTFFLVFDTIFYLRSALLASQIFLLWLTSWQFSCTVTVRIHLTYSAAESLARVSYFKEEKRRSIKLNFILKIRFYEKFI